MPDYCCKQLYIQNLIWNIKKLDTDHVQKGVKQ